jgi:hypothetical protein
MDFRSPAEKKRFAAVKKMFTSKGISLTYNSDYEEYKVKLKGYPNADYHTSDLDDAIGTANGMLAKRKKNPTVTASSLPIGEWQPAHAIRQNIDGTIDILREKNTGRRANISQGFMAGGVFHPIRSAGDYDPSRVGESGVYKKKRKKGAKPKATGRKFVPKRASTKKALPSSPRRYGSD